MQERNSSGLSKKKFRESSQNKEERSYSFLREKKKTLKYETYKVYFLRQVVKLGYSIWIHNY